MYLRLIMFLVRLRMRGFRWFRELRSNSPPQKKDSSQPLPEISPEILIYCPLASIGMFSSVNQTSNLKLVRFGRRINHTDCQLGAVTFREGRAGWIVDLRSRNRQKTPTLNLAVHPLTRTLVFSFQCHVHAVYVMCEICPRRGTTHYRHRGV